MLALSMMIALAITKYLEHTKYKEPAPGWSLVTDGEGNYSVKHDETGWVYKSIRPRLFGYTKQSAINNSWNIESKNIRDDTYQKKWK